MNDRTDRIRDLLVIGAGPAGLAVSIAAQKLAIDHEVLEKGTVVNSIFHFPRNMTFFTTPELLEIGGLPFVTPYEKPTRDEALKYYRRVVDCHSLPLRLSESVLEIAPVATAEAPLFRVVTHVDGETRERFARNVALATGYYDHPNTLGIPGEDRPHVAHYYQEAHSFYRRRVVVVGGKNSAAIAALELHRSGAQVSLVHRGDRLRDAIKYWIRPDIENRIKEGSIKAHFGTTLVEIREREVCLVGPEGPFNLEADDVLLLTGYHPDVQLMSGAGVRVDPHTLKPECDPETLESNVAGLYLAGAIVSGRETNKIFIENGRFHGEAIARGVRARLSSEPAVP